MKSRYPLGLVALTALLAGCGTKTSAASVSDTASASVLSTKADPKLTDADFENVGADDITFTVTNTYTGESGSASDSSVIRIGASAYIAEGEDGTYGFYKASSGKVVSDSITLKNTVEAETFNASYDSVSFLHNPLGSFTARYFEYNEDLSDDGNWFELNEDGLLDENLNTAFTALCETATYASANGLGNIEYYFESNNVTLNTQLAGAHVLADADCIQAIGATLDLSYTYDQKVTSVGKLAFEVVLSNVGLTNITADDAKIKPYEIPTDKATEYSAFEKALKEITAAKGYSIDAEVVAGGISYATVKGIILEEEYSFAATSYGSSDTDYYGVHRVSDTQIDEYKGSAANALKGVALGAATLPGYGFVPAVFDYVEKDTSGNFVFSPRAAVSADDVIAEFDILGEYGDYNDGNVEITVSPEGHLVSTEFGIAVESGTAGQKITYSAIGETIIPTEIADFSTYTAYVKPTGYDDIKDIDDQGTDAIESMTFREALVAVFGEDNAALIPDVIALSTTLQDIYAVAYRDSSDEDYPLFIQGRTVSADDENITDQLTQIIADIKAAGFDGKDDGYGGFLFDVKNTDGTVIGTIEVSLYAMDNSFSTLAILVIFHPAD
jgi:hypothetical protein